MHGQGYSGLRKAPLEAQACRLFLLESAVVLSDYTNGVMEPLGGSSFLVPIGGCQVNKNKTHSPTP